MATTGVMRPGHIQLRVLDLDESVEFYKNVLGLVETGRDAAGRVYFKAWDERDHNSVVLRQADRAGVDLIGFKVKEGATGTANVRLNGLIFDLGGRQVPIPASGAAAVQLQAQ